MVALHHKQINKDHNNKVFKQIIQSGRNKAVLVNHVLFKCPSWKLSYFLSKVKPIEKKIQNQ